MTSLAFRMFWDLQLLIYGLGVRMTLKLIGITGLILSIIVASIVTKLEEVL